MSLTSLIADKDSSVAKWFATTFPETRSVASEANVVLRGLDTKTPCVIPPPAGVDHGTVGTATGYVLSACLVAGALNNTVATSGAAALCGPLGPPAADPIALERQAVARIAELRPWEHNLSDPEWRELVELCCVLTRFEQYFRAGTRVLEHIDIPLRSHPNDLNALARALVSPVTRADTEALARAAVEDHLDLQRASPLWIGPTFAQSVALGGADADLIYDGTLIDLKATSKSSPVGRAELYQLLGYLLADSPDHYGITHVGLSALRRRRRHIWEAQQFISLLSGAAAVSLQQRREEFADVLAPMAAERAEGAQVRVLRRAAGLPDS